MLNIGQIYNIRIALHKTVYNDIIKIDYLVQQIEQLNLFNVEKVSSGISLKVKKTNIKKEFGTQYIHNELFYSKVLAGVFTNFMHKYSREINKELLSSNVAPEHANDITKIIGQCPITLLYHCVPVLDNIVNISF